MEVARYQMLSPKSRNVGQNYRWSDVFYWILKLRNITEVSCVPQFEDPVEELDVRPPIILADVT